MCVSQFLQQLKMPNHPKYVLLYKSHVSYDNGYGICGVTVSKFKLAIHKLVLKNLQESLNLNVLISHNPWIQQNNCENFKLNVEQNLKFVKQFVSHHDVYQSVAWQT